MTGDKTGGESLLDGNGANRTGGETMIERSLIDRVSMELWLYQAKCAGMKRTVSWRNAPIRDKGKFRAQAEVAFEAIRSPTRAMVAAGESVPHENVVEVAEPIWRAMVAAALEER